MTADFIALCRREPDTDTTLAALNAAGPELGIRVAEHAGLIQLCDDDGRTLVSIETPLLVQVPSEAGRLLGPGINAPHPVWWVEARASAPRTEDGTAGTGTHPSARPANAAGDATDGATSDATEDTAADGGATASPTSHPNGREAARRFTEALAAATGGCTWPGT